MNMNPKKNKLARRTRPVTIGKDFIGNEVNQSSTGETFKIIKMHGSGCTRRSKYMPS